MRIADVARDLGVTRQTVYRYFPSTESLLIACAMQTADGFLGRLERRVRDETDPVTTLVEGVAFTIESLTDDPQMAFLFSQREMREVGGSITSDTAYAFGRALLHRLDVDWEAHGFDEPALTELNEFCLRVVKSFLIDAGNPKRDPAELREFLARWLGPAIVYPQVSQTLGPLIGLKSASAASPRRRS